MLNQLILSIKKPLKDVYDLQTIALLHDIIEDTDYTEEQLREDFSSRVADAVMLLTKVEGESYQEYIVRLAKNEDVRLVKIADLTHNMDITRLGKLTDKGIERLKKYHNAYLYLKNYKNEKV
jgi:(p)ppGpp synthase/HD superfamily hydrolase